MRRKGEKVMRGREARVVGGVVLLAVILVAIAYAAITNVTLNINGTSKSQANQTNFVVQFVGEPTTGGKGTTTATINTSKRTEGTVDVEGLSAKGDTATATFTVQNSSQDLSADLTAKATSSNEDYFEVRCKIDATTLKAGATTELTVTVELLKTPIDETKEDLSTNIGVSITAEPKQPGEEANAGSTTVSSKKPITNPYLPEGFTKVDGTTLDNGLTIQDSTGNQYVWVEVPKTKEVYPTAGLAIKDFTNDEYTAIETDLHTYTSEYRNSTSAEDEYYADINTGLTSDEYYKLKEKMLKSVYQNGGFYVGKYETGIEDAPKTSGSSSTAPTETPVIKQNAYPYNYVTCSQAQTLASSMESGNYNTSLMFGVQWDLVLKYLETKGTAQADLKTNSTSWGNYYNNLWNITKADSKYYTNSQWTNGAYGAKGSDESILLSTGASDTFSKQGIYDLAGNVNEWTLEYSSDKMRASNIRGGDYSSDGKDFTPSHRYQSGVASDWNMAISFFKDIGFRVALY